ncbi:MAG TPA: AAA family ATPase, partial [Ktedonobacteraceae bacterium]
MNNMDHTISALLEALRFSPNNVRLRKQVAELLMQAARNEEAVEQWQIIYQQTEDPDCLSHIGVSYYNSKNFAEAKKFLLQALPTITTADTYLMLSKACYELGDYQEASDYYHDAINRDSELADQRYQDELLAHGAKVRLKVEAGDEGGHPYIPLDTVEQAGISFKDVGGLEALKEQIRMNIIYPFQQPELFKSFGRKVGGGLLLYGPPGCGKTFLARATAGECKAHFINISIHDVLDMYIGNSEKNLHEIFEVARRHTPTIIFIDELDALGGSRQQMHYHHGRMLTNQLLTELDGVISNNSEILTLGATNSPWFVDASLRRPGRFDRVLFVPPPDLEARIQILQLHLQGKPVEAIDYARVARQMEQFSGADIQATCMAASDQVIAHVMKTGKMRPMRTDDLLQAVKKVKPSTVEWVSIAKNYATYSNSA